MGRGAEGRRRGLTPRQAEVVELIARGRSNREIATVLGITEDGVKAHVRRLLEKYDVSNRAALVRSVQQDADGPQAEVSLPDLLGSVTATLSETIGTTAATNLVHRAMKRAADDRPELRPIGSGTREERWPDLRGAQAMDAFTTIMQILWPRLLAMSGQVLIRRLERGGINVAGEIGRDERSRDG
jgi:DNA-binding CsgD family transcriptional regulator